MRERRGAAARAAGSVPRTRSDVIAVTVSSSAVVLAGAVFLAAAVEMVEAILKDKKKILPCAAYLEGEY